MEPEEQKILRGYFSSAQGLNGKISVIPSKEKRKKVVLAEIAKRFDCGKNYTEQEVNEILHHIYDDYATLRRHMVEYGYMNRERDGSRYWLCQEGKDG